MCTHRKYSQNKEINEIVKVLTREGWKTKDGGKHLKLIAPGGETVSVSRSPSDRNAASGLRQDIKKIKEGRWIVKPECR